MTAAVLDRPGTLFADADSARTLEDLLTSVIDEARSNGSAECPVCRAEMSSKRAGAPAEAPGAAECAGCGSRLS